MKIYQFEIFTTVAKVKSFSKAAKLLYLSQPSVSKHIKSMENYYGTKLFKRSNQGVDLTTAGKVAYEYAQKILKTHSNLEKEIDKHLNLKNSNLIIGASITPGNYLLPCTIWTFKDKHPQIDIRLDINNTQQIIKKVLKNEVDIGIVEGEIPPEVNLTTKEIMKEELKFIAATSKYTQDTFTLTELKKLPLILLDKKFGIRQQFNKLIQTAGLNFSDLNIITEIGGISGIKSAVQSGLGISIVSHSAVKKEIYQNTIKAINIKGITEADLKMNLKLIYHNQDQQNEPNIISKFITFLNIQSGEIFC
ncbi:LysR family transcriptional regulator [Fuchsiella alkaliacetigena]|uniref:LysR family transcriptional regulator n=1 Tax=Fuchsiella alkaliacetigena TaxID=957042 RepID=UPI00200A8215|nr:LysR family transcriptional regulator [Fuchsiella alkaliacetigena]MCK8825462.1 LysR family transcriptional regulator [Fuchsiella alkaliacetigena]